ncbi:CHAT domain-containing tetratricopeptide repeat protein [Iningainema tapete]|uniref:CHAT domain-containing protein n=1 Tax=Iningainema tapete BLCC-T55 TaxID=2748662 RepID=A0A8J6XKT7_9CYAN|nr:CHAT domain-containing protein [Iningainema tapete]MBD2776543.1 CHAT domain-containing protein [Iningainema tapete BLCC-T55]
MKNQNKSLVVVTSRTRSLLSLCLRFPVSALFISIFLLSSVVAIPGRMGSSVAQQPTVMQQEETRAAAKRLLQQGAQLYKQGTAQSKGQALIKFEEALKLFYLLDDKGGEALTILGIGRVYSDLGEKQKALSYYNQALPLMRAVGYKAGEAITLSNIGIIYSDLGEKQKALSYYNQSLSLSREVGDKAHEAGTLNNIGAVYSDLGEKQKALSYYNQSLPLLQKAGNKALEATTLNNIGLVYDNLGEKQKALSYYNQSLPLSREVRDKAGEATTLNNIGLVYDNLGEKQTALFYYNQALPLSRAVDDKTVEATTLTNIGLVYDNLGEKQTASYYNQSLPLKRAVGDKTGEARNLNNIGSVYYDLGEKQKALTYFNQALPLLREVEDKALEATTLGNIAFLERSRGNLNAAVTPIKEAINIIEDLRTKVINQELRTSYFASKQGIYKFYIDLLMQLHKKDPSKGYNALALHISERARGRNLLELLAEANVDIRQGVDPKLVAQERSLQQQLNAAELQKSKLLQGQYTNKQLDNIKQLIESLDSQLDDVQAQIRVKSPEYATLTQGNQFDKLVLTLPQIQQQVLDDNTLLLEYSLGKERSYLWLVSKTGITTYELPKGADIQAAAQAFNKELLDKKDSAAIPETGIKLSQMILAPVASQLKQKRLLVVGDGALQTIPFTVLPIPGSSQTPTPLLVQNEIVTLPSASSIGVLRNKFKQRKKLPPKTIAVLADPVFSSDDPRLTNISQSRNAQSRDSNDECLNLGRLQYTENEANYILSLEPNSTKKFSALGFGASVNTAVKPDLSQYQIVHFATHGCISQNNPQSSKLVLSQFDDKGGNIDGDLNLNKIYNLKLPVELVTLSACKTGLGKNVQGEGLVGLTRGFMYAGAKRVVVSLWSVNDLTTASLMQQFYQKMLHQNQNPVAAMRTAQLEMWKSGKAPYYWAAFTIQGEWQ